MNEQRFQRGDSVDDQSRDAEAKQVVAELQTQLRIAQKAVDKLNALLIDEADRELKKLNSEEQDAK